MHISDKINLLSGLFELIENYLKSRMYKGGLTYLNIFSSFLSNLTLKCFHNFELDKDNYW